MAQDTPQAYTVTAITRMIKGALEESFPSMWVEGELSGYLHHSSGHHYFSLKDEGAVLKGVMWRAVGANLKFRPESGQKVLAFGDITVYEKGGNYQLNVRKLVPAGIGPLELAFRQLYEKLSAEGLFADDLKKALPEYPTTVGIVTSPTGAAIRDIIQIATRRNPSVKLIIYPAQVQGAGAEATVVRGIEYFNGRSDIDVIIIGRGGGSLEDLWPFNTELLVRAVAASRIPIVSAVGHEIDTTLSDLAADFRAPTPSAAAEIVIWSKREFQQMISGEIASQARLLQYQVVASRNRLQSLLSRTIFTRPSDQIYQRRQYVDNLIRVLMSGGKFHFEQAKNRLSLAMSKLETLSPMHVLQRGYSVTRTMSGSVVRSADTVQIGENLETILSEGSIISVVQQKGKK